MTLIARGCRRAIKDKTEVLTPELLDHVRNDVAAESARKELEAAFELGLLTLVRKQIDRCDARPREREHRQRPDPDPPRAEPAPPDHHAGRNLRTVSRPVVVTRTSSG